MKASKEISWWALLPFQIAAFFAWGVFLLAYGLVALSPLVGIFLLLAWIT